jgi:hydroxyacylglutathione hydrolase
MTPFQFHQFLYGKDNYGVLMHDPASGQTAAIDAGDSAAYQVALAETGWTLSHILLTHHHWDHTDGVAALSKASSVNVYGPEGDKAGHEGVTHILREGDQLAFGETMIEVIATPGHTLDMLNYYLPEQKVCFTGDTLFSLGCGRIFEGTAEMMWDSLTKLMALPADTTIYSSHEYTEANARFALTIDPENTKLQARCALVSEKRAHGQPTVPSLLADELATNPFLRASDKQVRAHLNMAQASDKDVFAEIRTRKDNF